MADPIPTSGPSSAGKSSPEPNIKKMLRTSLTNLRGASGKAVRSLRHRAAVQENIRIAQAYAHTSGTTLKKTEASRINILKARRARSKEKSKETRRRMSEGQRRRWESWREMRRHSQAGYEDPVACALECRRVIAKMMWRSITLFSRGSLYIEVYPSVIKTIAKEFAGHIKRAAEEHSETGGISRALAEIRRK